VVFGGGGEGGDVRGDVAAGVGLGDASEGVAVRQALAGLLQNSSVVGLGATGAEGVVEVEVEAVVVVGAEQLAAGPDVGVLPGKSGVRRVSGVSGVSASDAHLGELLATQAEDVVVGGVEAVGGGVAGPCGDGAFGDARAIGVIEVAGHGTDAGDGVVVDGADAAFSVIEILVDAVVGYIAGVVVGGRALILYPDFGVCGIPGPQKRGTGGTRLGTPTPSAQNDTFMGSEQTRQTRGFSG